MTFHITVRKDERQHFIVDPRSILSREHALEVYRDLRSRFRKTDGFVIIVLEFPQGLGTDVSRDFFDATKGGN